MYRISVVLPKVLSCTYLIGFVHGQERISSSDIIQAPYRVRGWFGYIAGDAKETVEDISQLLLKVGMHGGGRLDVIAEKAGSIVINRRFGTQNETFSEVEEF